MRNTVHLSETRAIGEWAMAEIAQRAIYCAGDLGLKRLGLRVASQNASRTFKLWLDTEPSFCSDDAVIDIDTGCQV